jgi:hypothetical protein
MIRIEEAELERNVMYIPFDRCDDKLIEYGIITGWGDRYIFVRYGTDEHSKSTPPERLFYVSS